MASRINGISTITVGPYQGNLIDRGAMRFTLRFEGLQNPANGGPAPRCRG
ncbi:MAG TPA: hypothetical protein VGV86_01695 [Acidimicrobiales bacterium]|nr:hypothetical protein [Acidimicrobiales bacterium]